MGINLNSVCIKICAADAGTKKLSSTNTHTHTHTHTFTLTHTNTHSSDTLISQYTVTAHVSQLTPVTVLLSCELIVIDCTVFLTEDDTS